MSQQSVALFLYNVHMDPNVAVISYELLVAQSNSVVSMVEQCAQSMDSDKSVPTATYVEALGTMVSEGVNLDKILDISSTSKLPRCPDVRSTKMQTVGVRLAVAKDAAFSFYYHE